MLRQERLSGRAGAGGDAGMDDAFLSYLEDSREVMRDASWFDYARCLRNLAVATKAAGDRDSARRMRLLLVAIGLETSDPSEKSRPDYAEFLDDFVELLEESGELNLAESLAVASILHRRASHGERHLEYAAGLARLAGYLRARGDLAQSMLLFEKALAIRRQAMGEHHDLVEILLPMAELYDDIGNHDDARCAVGLCCWRSAMPTSAAPCRPCPSGNSSRCWPCAKTVSTMLDITASRGGSDAETYALLASWKGITIEAARVERTTQGTGEAVALRNELRGPATSSTGSITPSFPTRNPRSTPDGSALVERSADLETRLAQAVGWKPVRIGLPEIQAALPAGAVFIDLYHYQRRGRPAVPEGASPFAVGPVASRSLRAEIREHVGRQPRRGPLRGVRDPARLAAGPPRAGVF